MFCTAVLYMRGIVLSLRLTLYLSDTIFCVRGDFFDFIGSFSFIQIIW